MQTSFVQANEESLPVLERAHCDRLRLDFFFDRMNRMDRIIEESLHPVDRSLVEAIMQYETIPARPMAAIKEEPLICANCR